MPGVRIVLGLMVLVAAVAAAQGSAVPAAAATNRAWIGGANGNFFVASNWLPAGVPVDGDVLIFHRASNGLANTITVLGNYQTLPKIASITSDIYNLKITGVMTITKSVFAETNKSSITFDSLTLDGEAIEFSMQQSSLVPELSSVIRVERQLTIHGSLVTHRGQLRVDQVLGNGSLAETDGTIVIADLEEFAGTISGTGNGGLGFITPPSGTCDQSGTRLVADATTTIWLDWTCPQSFASIEGNGTIAQGLATRGTIQLALTDGRGIFNGRLAADAPVALTCCGTGEQRIGGNFGAALQVDVTGGSLVAESLTLNPGTITNVGNGASFGGFGVLGAVSINEGTLLMGGGIGNFEALMFTSSGNATFQIRGASTQSLGQAKTKGVLDLGSASANEQAGTLSVAFQNGFVPAVGTPLALIVGASDVQGTFKGLPEGAVTNFGEYSFRITYEGGASGHDVVITRQASAASPTPTATPTGTPTPAGNLKYRRFIPVVGRDG